NAGLDVCQLAAVREYGGEAVELRVPWIRIRKHRRGSRGRNRPGVGRGARRGGGGGGDRDSSGAELLVGRGAGVVGVNTAVPVADQPVGKIHVAIDLEALVNIDVVGQGRTRQIGDGVDGEGAAGRHERHWARTW